MTILRTYGALIAGAVLAIAGVLVLLTQRASGAPAFRTVEATGPTGKVPPSPDPSFGLLLVAIGVLIVLGWVVHRLVRRRAVSPDA